MRITAWSVAHPTPVFVLMGIIVVLGLSSYQGMPRESFPDIEIPYVLVNTVYVGVSSGDIETLVTQPLETELLRLRDTREVRSTSMDNVSVIVVEFDPKVPMDVALQRTRDRVEAARPNLPTEADDPDVVEISLEDMPVLLVNISGEVGIARLQLLAEQLQDRIERIPGVLEARIRGGVERIIAIEADAQLLDTYGISFNELMDAVQSENVNIPGGTLDIGALRYTIRTPGELEDWTELEDLVVRNIEGETILVRDVARVLDTFRDRDTISRLNGVESVTVDVSRRAGANILNVTDDIKSLVADIQAQYGETVTFTLLSDTSDMVRSQVAELENNILSGLFLVAALLLFFMGGLRNALFVAVAVPMSMLLSFSILAMMGITLNMVTLFSLVLALGLLVDNGIVVVENIYRNAVRGIPLEEAALQGVEQVGWPVIASTATTIAAFAPMLFWPGLMGRFMYFLPLTVIVVLCSSLFVALVILPVVCSRFMTVPRRDTEAAVEDDLAALPGNLLYKAYGGTLRLALRFRPLVLLATLGLFFGTLALFGQHNAGVVFMPDTTPETFVVNVALPDGYNLETSNDVLARIEAILEDEPDVVNWVADVGAGLAGDMFGGGGNTPHKSRITVDLRKVEEQGEDPRLLMSRIRAVLARLPAVEGEVVPQAMGPPVGDPIHLQIRGPRYEELGHIAERLRSALATLDGIVDLRDDFETGRSDITIRVDRRRASQVGARTSDIAFTVRAAMNGVEVSSYRDAGEEYDIVLRLAPSFRQGVEDVSNLFLTTRTGQRVRLSEIADIRLTPGTGAITRVDGAPVVTVTGDLDVGWNANERQARVRMLLETFDLPVDVAISFGGESRDQEEAAAFLGSALLVALLLIVLILITQFNSVAQPLIIMVSVILSVVGILWQLMLMAEPFVVIMTGMAIISLAGVVVNNSIVLTEFTNQYRDQGYAAADAAYRAGMVRLRPVLLTAFTTSSSLVPTVLGYNLNVQSFALEAGGTSVEFWGPMARAIVVGLIFAAFMTLIVVPTLYVSIETTRARLGTLMGWLKGLARTGSGGSAPPTTASES